MGREVEWDLENICDDCGVSGAWDFMGDYICEECLEKAKKNSIPLDEIRKEIEKE